MKIGRESTQRGAVMLLLLGVLGSVSVFWWLQSEVAAQRLRLSANHSEQIVRELQQAKLALISYAVTYADNYKPRGAGVGHLPCPDLDAVDDGNPHNDGPNPPCGQPDRQLGRLPRETFTFASPLQTDSRSAARKRLSFHAHQSNLDQQPWYRVSSAFVNNPVTTLVNPDTEGTLRVDQQRDVIAVVIAPGPALAAQTEARPDDEVQSYLEAVSVNADSVFTRVHDVNMNDLLVYITRQELLPLLERRVLGFVHDWLVEFQNQWCPAEHNCYPFAGDGLNCRLNRLDGNLAFLPGDCESALTWDGLLDGVALNEHWFIRNQWHNYIRYELAPECVNADVRCQIKTRSGSLSQSSQSLVMIVPGDN